MKSKLSFNGFKLHLLVILCGIFISANSIHAAELPLNDIRLPPGFAISIYGNVPNARSLTLSPKGTLFVGSLKEGKVYAVANQPGETEARKIFTIAQGLNMPNGVAFRNGALYVAEVNRLLRYDDIESRLANPRSRSRSTTNFQKTVTTDGSLSLLVPMGCSTSPWERLAIYVSPTKIVTRSSAV